MAANTFHRCSKGEETCFYDFRFPSKRIDFWLISRGNRRFWTDVVDSEATKSDHSCVKLIIELEGEVVSREPTPQRGLRKPISWKKIQDDYADMADDVLKARQKRSEQTRPGLTNLTAAIQVASRAGGKPSRKPGLKQVEKDHPEMIALRDLEYRRRLEQDPRTHLILHRKVLQQRRKVQRIRDTMRVQEETANLKRRKPMPKQALLDEPNLQSSTTGERLVTREAKQKELTEVFQRMYKDEQQEVPKWVMQRWSIHELRHLPPITGTLIRTLARKLARNKTSADDMIVGEMLLELSEDFFDELAKYYENRMRNLKQEAQDTAWDDHLVRLIRKKVLPRIALDLRPIAVLPILQKMYLMLLLNLAEDKMQLHHQQFAYRKTYQAHEVVSLLRLIIEKAAEWQRSLIIIDGDVWKAYDRLRHKPLAVTLTRRGVVRMVTAALIREVRRCSFTFQMDSVRSQRVS